MRDQQSAVSSQRSEQALSAIRYHVAVYHAACALHGNQASAAWYLIECVEKVVGLKPGTYVTKPVLEANEPAARALHEARGGVWKGAR